MDYYYLVFNNTTLDINLLFKSLSVTSVPTEELTRFLDEYIRTFMFTVLGSVLQALDDNQMNGDIDEIGDLVEDISKMEDQGGNDAMAYYQRFLEVLNGAMKIEYVRNSLEKTLEKEINELDDKMLNALSVSLSESDREKVLKRLDVLAKVNKMF